MESVNNPYTDIVVSSVQSLLKLLIIILKTRLKTFKGIRDKKLTRPIPVAARSEA